MDNLITDEARRFREFRLAEKLTQEEMGEILGKTKSHINKVEKGILRISVEDVKTLHAKKRMSYEWFYNGEGSRIASKKEENLIKVTTDLRNQVELLSQKIDQQDKALKKLYRDYYGLPEN